MKVGKPEEQYFHMWDVVYIGQVVVTTVTHIGMVWSHVDQAWMWD